MGTPTSARHVAVVGASLGGMRVAGELRAAGHEGPITVLGAERHLPYDRPPLSKQVLTGAWTEEKIRLPAAVDDSLGLQLCLGTAVRGVGGGRLYLDDSSDLPFDDLVIATGVDARRLPGQPEHDSIQVLRTLDDSRRLRAALTAARSLLIVGGGFIGAEVAAAARGYGVEVTVVEALHHPFERVLGAAVGHRLASLHRDHSVRFEVDARIESFVTSAGSAGVRLADGRVLGADHVLVGVGTVAETGWWPGAVDAAAGLPCDSSGRVARSQRVFAVGDIAAWWDDEYAAHRRVEHWTSATEQARVVARTLVGRPPEVGPAAVPYFWSDQYRTKVQMVGRTDLATRVDLYEMPAKPDRLVAAYLRDGRLTAAVTFSAPAVLARMRPLVLAGAGMPDVRAAADELGLAAVSN